MRYIGILGNFIVAMILIISTFLNPPFSLSLILFELFIFFLLGVNLYYLFKPTEKPNFIATYIKRCNVDQEIKLIEAQNKLRDYQKRSF